MSVMAVTIKCRRCDKCGRRVRFTLLPNYHDRSGRRWCLPCVRERYPVTPSRT